MASAPDTDIPAAHGAPLHMAEFVALIAALISLGALGIDTMLPALPAIGSALHAPSENARQLVITAFVVGFGVAQIVHGPLSDRFGRRPTLIVSLLIYVVANVLCAISQSFALLLAARVLGGVAIAATRVSTVAIVRDCFQGRAMARVMSIAFLVFMIVPILAPAFGAGVLLLGNWRVIFWVVGGVALAVIAWFAWRMPETLHPEDRLPLSPARIASGWRLALTDRLSLGYTLAATALQGALYGYLSSIQQVMADTFGRPRLLVLVFAVCGAVMACSNLTNARLVVRVGTRRLSHGAVLVLLVASTIHLVTALTGHETLTSFVVLQAIALGCFGLAGANFAAMAMENMGHIAGTASSVQGFASVTLGGVIGALIGQAYDGTTVPLACGFTVAGVAALACVLVTERGRLFGTR